MAIDDDDPIYQYDDDLPLQAFARRARWLVGAWRGAYLKGHPAYVGSIGRGAQLERFTADHQPKWLRQEAARVEADETALHHDVPDGQPMAEVSFHMINDSVDVILAMFGKGFDHHGNVIDLDDKPESIDMGEAAEILDSVHKHAEWLLGLFPEKRTPTIAEMAVDVPQGPPMKPDAARDRYCYEQGVAGVRWDAIMRQVNAHPEWSPLGHGRSAQQRAEAYREKHGLPPIPQRKANRGDDLSTDRYGSEWK